MKVAIIGSSGGMGTYFVRRFLEGGHTVTGHDRRNANPPVRGLASAGSNSEAVASADVVVLSVPIDQMGKVAREVAPSLKRGVIIVEIASLKSRVRRELAAALRGKKAKLISIHPMFGPRSTSRNPRILVLGGPGDMEVSGSLFPWADLVPLGNADHDRTMAFALGLVHVSNLAFLSTLLKGIGVREFEKVSSPMGKAQLTLAEAVVSQDPALYWLIQTENPSAHGAIASLIEELRTLENMVRKRDRKQFRAKFAYFARQFPESTLTDALDQVYSAFG